MNLGARLESVYLLVPNGAVLADVGSDHGYLPAKLVKDGKIERAAVCDINVGPLDSARKTASRFGVSKKLSFFLSDGLDSVDYDYDTVAICGMGGILISEIMARAPKKDVLFLLQPMRSQELLRKYLWDEGYEIIDEAFSFEHGKPYVVLKSKKNQSSKESYTLTDLYLGKTSHRSPARTKYNEKLISSLEKKILGAGEAEKEALFAVIEKIRAFEENNGI